MGKLKRRGVFPVIAVLALVIIGVAGGVFVYKFVDPFISRLQSQTDVSNILTIEGVKVTGNKVEIAVTNLGTGNVSISSVILVDPNTGALRAMGQVSETIGGGESKVLTVTFDRMVEVGKSYLLKVLGSGGATAASMVVRVRGSSYWDVTWYEVTSSSGSFGNDVGSDKWAQLNYNYNWGAGNVYNGYSDHIGYSASASIYFTSTSTTVTITTDDGMEVYIDGNPVFNGDAWKLQPATTYSKTVTIAQGYHYGTVKWYEWGGYAVSKLTITNAEFRP